MNTAYDSKLISVILPVYNAQAFIAQTLESVLKQTYQSYELILIDDCSVDHSADIIRQYMKRDKRIVYFRHNENQGAAAARNTGLKLARGKYIAFLDSDDLWRRDKLKRQIEFMKEHPEIAFCYTAYDTITETGERKRGKIKIKPVASYQDLLTKTIIATPTVLYDREKTGDVWMPQRRTGQDYAFWLLLLKQHNAYGINKPLVHVRRRGGSLSKNKFQNIRDLWEIQHHLEQLPAAAVILHIIVYMFNVLIRLYL